MSIRSEIILNTFQQIFHEWCGEMFTSVTPIKPGASLRKIFRIKSDKYRCIGIYNENVKENIAFTKFTFSFINAGIKVPQIYKVSEDYNFYLEEDLGDLTLYKYSLENKPDELYKLALDKLSDIQIKLRDKIDYSYCYETESFNNEQLLFDLNKFEKYFLNQFEIEINNLESIKDILIGILENSNGDFFMFRDFQPRNIMLLNDEMYFIDYQSGRKGLPEYDTASFIFSGSSFIDEKDIAMYFNYYKNNFISKYNGSINLEFNNFLYVALMRIFQMLGSYGYSYFVTKNKNYILKINKQIKNLNYISENLGVSLISECVNRIKLSSFISRINSENNSN